MCCWFLDNRNYYIKNDIKLIWLLFWIGLVGLVLLYGLVEVGIFFVKFFVVKEVLYW